MAVQGIGNLQFLDGAWPPHAASDHTQNIAY